jgi:hypothetical protein
MRLKESKMKSPIGKIVGVLFIAIVGVFAVVMVQDTINSQLPADASAPIKALFADMGPLMGVITVIAMFVAIFGGYKVVQYIRTKKWADFGNRMKAAYTAKFGYENTGFNEEVDQHIAVMHTLGKGYTKSLNEDWLKRMAKFVEIPYIIPEEEHESEEDKTKEFE